MQQTSATIPIAVDSPNKQIPETMSPHREGAMPVKPEPSDDIVRFKHVAGWLITMLVMSGTFAGWVVTQIHSEASKSEIRFDDHAKEEIRSHARIETKIDKIYDLLMKK